MLLAEDGDDGTGWIFNRFVSGSTMGGGIVVNIITYRSLRLHFPRPCQTAAITHSSQPHRRTHTHTDIPFSWLAVTVTVYTISMSMSYDPFNPPYILLLYNLAFLFPHLLKQP